MPILYHGFISYFRNKKLVLKGVKLLHSEMEVFSTKMSPLFNIF